MKGERRAVRAAVRVGRADVIGGVRVGFRGLVKCGVEGEERGVRGGV